MATYLKRQELADLLRVSPDTISAWVKQGLPCIRFSNRTARFNLDEVRQWVKGNEGRDERGGTQ
jgi:excisionase family DNA binding protein